MSSAEGVTRSTGARWSESNEEKHIVLVLVQKSESDNENHQMELLSRLAYRCCFHSHEAQTTASSGIQNVAITSVAVMELTAE